MSDAPPLNTPNEDSPNGDFPRDDFSGGDLPKHIAIIMDGNGRWARGKTQPRVMGHREGAKAVRRAVTRAAERGIEFLTLYSFSSENWNRPIEEVGALMDLLRRYLQDELPTLIKDNIQFRTIGDTQKLPADIVKKIDDVTQQTAHNTGLTLVLALSYGGRDELLRAQKRMMHDVVSGTLQADDVDEQTIEQYLDTHGIPDPDMIVRTSSEYRLSNFLMWQSAYSEFLFLEKHWPDFDEADMDAVITEYQKRERRYGKV